MVRGYWQAQASTEYLVLLAVILVLTVLGVAVLTYLIPTASEQKMAESRLYWMSQKPVSIVEGVGTDGAGEYVLGGENAVLLRLKNSGNYPIELLAIRVDAMSPVDAITGPLTNTEYGSLSSDTYTYLSPGGNIAYNYYKAFVKPPVGDGYTESTRRIELKPGQEATVGLGLYANGAGAPPVMPCRNVQTNQTSKYMELGLVEIYVVEKIKNQSIVKKVLGTEHLTVPCAVNYQYPFS